ncbi:hypothetical protein QN391_00665 [Pseudomonas sp. CCI1.2]|uniref:hypothetical protein n=1 Tax=Pseudomonas sp. CCI1.2 TaxID=3048614 RepID=UPI002B2225D7|nr:hypothetical protein [Pseudomonas sp. CCI1.2]MEB0119219.1 hypothetical protein [Pseudomonas sp. CCI1.2]
MFDEIEWENKRLWLKRKSKEAGNLSPQDLEFIDTRIMENLKENLRHWAAQEWWKLFGSQGHMLRTPEDELNFIAALDKVFIYPTPSTFLTPPIQVRQKYTVTALAKRGGARQKITFDAPPVSRLLELMLYGFFDFEGRWIFLHRASQLSGQAKTRQQWHVLEEGIQPPERLGVRVTVNSGWRGRHHPPANAAFSSLPTASKEYAAADHGSQGTHQDWMEGLADNLCEWTPWEGAAVSLELAGEYGMESYPLADLIAQGDHVGRKRADQINGNILDCRPENLKIRSSAGRKMRCSLCKKPTNNDSSKRVKDSLGSSVRICVECIKDRI